MAAHPRHRRAGPVELAGERSAAFGRRAPAPGRFGGRGARGLRARSARTRAVVGRVRAGHASVTARVLDQRPHLHPPRDAGELRGAMADRRPPGVHDDRASRRRPVRTGPARRGPDVARTVGMAGGPATNGDHVPLVASRPAWLDRSRSVVRRLADAGRSS